MEISHLKQELSRSKRELEIAAKSSLPPQNAVGTAKADAGTLSLAIKSFKVSFQIYYRIQNNVKILNSNVFFLLIFL